MTGVNAERGEVALTVGGRTYRLRPTFEALCEIEDAVGVKILPLAQAIRYLGAREIAHIVLAGLRAADPARADSYSMQAVGQELIDGGGLFTEEVREAISRFLDNALTGGAAQARDAEKRVNGQGEAPAPART